MSEGKHGIYMWQKNSNEQLNIYNNSTSLKQYDIPVYELSCAIKKTVA